MSRISINEGIKGKNNLRILSSSLKILKIIFIVGSLIPLNQATNTIYDFIKGEKHYRETAPYMKDKYVAYGAHSGSFGNEVGKEKEIALIKDELTENHNAFRYVDTIIVDSEDPQSSVVPTKQISVDRSYIEFHNIDIKLSNRDMVISSDPMYCIVNKVIQENFDCIFNDSIRDSLVSYSPHYQIEYYYLEGYFPNYKHVNNPYLLFLFEENIIEGTYFTNENGLKDAQKTLDDLYLKYGIEPTYTVVDVELRIENDRNLMISYLNKAVISLISLVISYIILSTVTAEVESLNNKVKHYLEYVEGKKPISLITEQTVRNSFLYPIILILGLLLNIPIVFLVVTIIAILLGDIITFIFTLKKTRKEVR